MISFEAAIRQLGQEVRNRLKESEKIDTPTLRILEDGAAPLRSEAIHDWLQKYHVFQGIDGPSRLAVAAAVLKWADSRDSQGNLATVSALADAHEELRKVCAQAINKKQGFTSLASKAL